jgi:hypothetical protein
MQSLVLLLFSIVPQPGGVLTDRVEVIEVNVCWALDTEDCQKPYLRQLIFWSTNCDGEAEIVDWRLIKGDMYPVKERGEWVVTWTDGQILRQVRAPLFRLRHTGYDVEMHDRARFPDYCRRRLTPHWLTP